MSKKVITFGEIMIRLQTPGFQRFIQADSLEMVFGGGEANVAVSLANYGMEPYFVTKLPKNPMGDACIASLRKYGVNTSYIARGGERMGIYFVEKGASQRASNVVYDRAHASIATAEAADFDWEKIFDGAEWFHFTGITPALSDACAELSLAACKAAKAAGVQISCDPEKVFGIKAAESNITGGELSDEGYKDVARQLVDRFGCKKIAITLRESISASVNNWAAMMYDAEKKEFYKSKKYTMNIVDRVGGGDSFGGGLIYALLSGYDNQSVIEFATAASCLKHTIEGDFNLVSVAEVENLMKGDGSGRVQR